MVDGGGARAAYRRPVDALEVGEPDARAADLEIEAIGGVGELLEDRANLVAGVVGVPCAGPLVARAPARARVRAAGGAAGSGLRTPSGGTSSRSRTNTGARSRPAGVHSLKVTSATSSGLSQVVGRCSGGLASKGESLAHELRRALAERGDRRIVETGARHVPRT